MRTTSMLVLHLMVKIEFLSERYKDLAHPLTERLGGCRKDGKHRCFSRSTRTIGKKTLRAPYTLARTAWVRDLQTSELLSTQTSGLLHDL